MASVWLDSGVAAIIAARRQELGHPQMTKEELSESKIQGAQLILIGDMVFDVKGFVALHPGGEHALLRNLGHDATEAFRTHHGQDAHAKLAALFHADLVEINTGKPPATASSTTGMDAFGTSPLSPSASFAGTISPLTGLTLRANSNRNLAPSAPHTVTAGADASACPFMALANLAAAQEGAAPRGDTSPLQGVPKAPPPGAPVLQRSNSRRSAIEGAGPGSFRGSVAASRAGIMNSSFRGSVAGASRAGGASRSGSRSASRAGGGSTHGSSQPSQGGVRGVGGVYQTRQRRKERRAKDSGAPETDPDKYREVAALITASWDAVLEKASFEDIGVYIYDRITTQETLEPLFSFSDKASQGRKFVDMLNSLMANIDSPDSIHAKMVELAPMHHRRGVTAVHLPVMGPLLIDVFAALGGPGFTHEMRSAWAWFWEFLSRSMIQSLNDVGSTLNIVQRSWDDIMERHSNLDLGRKMFDELVRTAPSLSQQFFSAEKANDMASKMGDMLGLLVSFTEDPAQLKQQVTWLGRRHVTYKVRPQMITLMGPVMMNALAEAADASWGRDEEAAWQVVLNIIIESMQEAIGEGERYGASLQELWALVAANSCAEEFGSQLYPYFTKACVCTFLQGFCQECDTSAPFFSDIAEDRSFSEASSRGAPLGTKTGFGEIVTPSASLTSSFVRAETNGDGLSGSSVPHLAIAPRPPRRHPRTCWGSHPPARAPGNGAALARGRVTRASRLWSGRLARAAGARGPRLGRRPSPPPRASAGAPRARGASDRRAALRASRARSAPGRFRRSRLPARGMGRQRRSACSGSRRGTCSRCSSTTRGRLYSTFLRHWLVLVMIGAGRCHSTRASFWQPEVQQEKIYVISSQFFRRGMRATHIPMFGEALRGAVAQAVGKAFGDKLEASWDWFWRDLSAWLVRDLESLEAGNAEVVVHHWAQVQDTYAVEKLGEIFWKHVNEEAPEQTHIYKLPLKMWGHLLKHIINMLLLSVSEPERFYEELFALVIRHIRYGVRAEFLTPMGRAIFSVLGDCLGDQWDDRARACWSEVYRRVATSMARGLNLGGSSITHGLVSGNVAAFQSAVAVAPRGSRARWLCEVNVNGMLISPLYWAINDGKLAIAEFILADLLTIRGDMTGYYYGRQELFDYHPDLVQQLTSKAPGLIDTLLDGCLWHSKDRSDSRHVKVNYYVADLYGDPERKPDVWTSPLAVFVQESGSETFTHPAVRKVLELKWNAFGLRLFVLSELGAATVLVLFVLTHTQLVAGEIGDMGCSPMDTTLSIMNAVSAFMLLTYQLCVITMQLVRRKTIPVGFKGMQLTVPRYLSHFWTWVRLFAGVLVVVLFFVDGCGPVDHHTATHRRAGQLISTRIVPTEIAMQAFAALLLWVQITQATIVSTRMAAFTYIIGIMVDDLVNTFVMIAILLLAFASALSIVHDAPFATFQDSVLILTEEILGLAAGDILEDVSWLTMLLVVAFIIAVVVGFLNILVAQLTITYKGLNKHKEGFALKHRASVCLDIEDLLPVRWRTKIFRSFGFDEPLAFGKDDVGPPGGIQVLEPEGCDRYEPDRIMRFTGASSQNDPWAVIDEDDSGSDRGAD